MDNEYIEKLLFGICQELARIAKAIEELKKRPPQH
jgi:hypothetical protein